ncbi:WD repeat-containing protein 89 [Zancudomyces culisetae]|uniref:WD repeat-containing protein 89 n=1 Tax=Zancudomyces culisetae TaxID=1213189 RepID=A0A1R1PR22_ZANCU|nr:WD repeat-containing protein 89 [Zancudomyces culisetae]|eukprot:OMH83435.1 WD repeat-containing protein 89 [Zancudomyces culisetae]
MNCVGGIEIPRDTQGNVCYVQTIHGTSSGILSTNSLNEIRLYDYEQLAEKSFIGAQNSTITSVKKQNDNIFITSGNDGIRVWDIRSANRVPVQEIKSILPILSFDTSCDEQILIAGTEQVDTKRLKASSGSNSLAFSGKRLEDFQVALMFWDLRNTPAEMNIFLDTHSNDITQVKCHSTNKNVFLSASTDGLICTYDIEKEFNEDDSMQFSCNTNVSVQKSSYFGQNDDFIYSLSDMDNLSLWSLDGTLISDYGRIGEQSPFTANLLNTTVDYSIDCLFDSSMTRLFLCVGDFEGRAHFLNVGVSGYEKVLSLEGGHNDIVRCIDCDFINYKVITGGEDGKICLWSTQPADY